MPALVDEPVYASEVPFDIFKERDDRLLVGHVGCVAFDLDSRSGAKIDSLLQIRLVDVHQRKVDAFGCKILGHFLAKALSRARDDDHLVPEIHVHTPSFCSRLFVFARDRRATHTHKAASSNHRRNVSLLTHIFAGRVAERGEALVRSAERRRRDEPG